MSWPAGWATPNAMNAGTIMKTKMHILRVGQPAEIRDVEFTIPKDGPKDVYPDEQRGPGFLQLQRLIEPLLGDGEPLEHVSVLWNDRHADMFVSELGHQALTTRPPLPINREATAIYRANWLKQHPGESPDALPTIAGTAILFERRVWF